MRSGFRPNQTVMSPVSRSQAFIDAAEIDHGYEVEIIKKIKPGSGIGSSAASACGAVVAANILAGEPFSKKQLVGLAMAGEMLASGSRHADNLAPCIFGGFTLVRSADPLDIVSLEFPELFVTVIHPQIEIKTAEARAILPKQVPLADAVQNWSNLGAFVAALQTGDKELLSRSMVDVIVEPARSSLIPKFEELKRACLDVGAIGGGISGSGPSMFMLSGDRLTAQRIAGEMTAVYSPTGIETFVYVSPLSQGGVRAVS